MRDWSKHRMTIENHDDFALVHTLDRVGSYHKVSFVNMDGHGLLVTGSHGHWAFKNRFAPKAGSVADEWLWVNSLKAANFAQDVCPFDPDELKKGAENMLEALRKRGTIKDGDEFSWHQARRFAADLLDCKTAGQVQTAIKQCRPHFIDYEDCPHGMLLDHDLQAVIYAYNEVCRRLADLLRAIKL